MPLLVFLFFARDLFAFPNKEKAALSLLSSQSVSLVMDGDRFLYSASGNTISRIDTETFDLAADQVPALTDNSSSGGSNLTGDVGGMAIRAGSLFVTQSDGDLLTINLSNVTASPSTVHVADGALGALVGDPDTADDQLYILDTAHNAVAVFDLSNQTAVSIPLMDGGGSPVTPKAIAFAASTSVADKIYVTSERGLIFVIQEAGTSVLTTIQVATTSTNNSLTSSAVTPDGAFLLVTDATDNVVHVIDTNTNAEIDTDPLTPPGTLPVDPIALPKNGSLNHILVTDVNNPTDVYAYVSGSAGVSVIDLNETTVGFQAPAVIDFNDTGTSDTDDDPMPVSSAPGLMASSSAGDGYIYASDSNATISVITEKPFVVISSTSLGSSSLTTGGTFSLTFRTDETGTFRVLSGGDETANGTELTTGLVDTAGIDVTTSDIAFDSSLFQEGANRVFVFMTDASGLVGRDAVDINVNTPPTGVEILKTNFGDQKIFVTFARLTTADIDHYNVYLDTDPANVATRTDAAGTVAQTTSGGSIEIKIVGLINGVTYFVGVEGVDTSGLAGVRTTTFNDGTPAQATPEATVGLAGATGESGCGLVTTTTSSSAGFVWLVLGALVLVGARFTAPGRSPKGPLWGKLCPCIIALFIFLPSTLGANQLTPQWFSLEFKGGAWVPTNGTTRNFLGTFSPMGKVEFGFLYKSKFGAEVGVGFIGASGTAVGTTSGAVSGDHFGFMMIPIDNSFVFRADFKEDQLLVPYVKAGPDYVIFRESGAGKVTSGVKFGLHGAIGLQILLDNIDGGLSATMERTMRVNDIYFTVEGRYGWISNFGGHGVDLSGLTMTGGFLFEF